MNRLTKSVASVLLGMTALTFFSCDDEGSNVIGLNDAAKYGKITVTFEGTRSDGEQFTEKKTFRFMPEEGPEASQIQHGNDGNTDIYFYVQRMHGAVNNSHNDNYAGLFLQVDAEGNPVQAGMYFETSIIGDDNVFFYLSGDFGFDPADITSYNYSEGTNKLKLKFTTVIDGSNNETENDLTVTVDANVTVFEGLNGGFGGDF